MIKLAIVYPVFYEQISGGAELQISYLAKYAKQNGYEVHYIYVDRNRPYSNYDNLILHSIPLKGKCIRYFQYSEEIQNKLAAIRPDIIYTRYSSCWAYYAAQYAQKNCIKHIHAFASDKAVKRGWLFRKFVRSPLAFLDDYYFCRGIKMAGHLIAQNQFQQNELLRNYKRTSVIIDQMTPAVAESVLSKSADPIHVLWVANLKNLKQPELFVQLVKQLERSQLNKNYRMIMIGRMSSHYKDLIEDAQKELSTFQYLGELSQEEVYAELNKASILINTSVYEGFSNTFVQAWMRKVPVISMNSNPNETLTVHGLGFLAPKINELKEKTLLLIENNSMRLEMSEKAYRYALENHSIERNMPKLLSLLKS